MISIDEAYAILLREAGAGAHVQVELVEAHGHALAEDACADRDFPPFDQARVDGFALRSEDVIAVPRVLDVIEYVPAGKVPTHAVGPGQAVRIMTGAPVPVGADAVVMQEHTQPAEKIGPAHVRQEASPAHPFSASHLSQAVLIERPCASEANIARRGSDVQRGTTVISAGTRLGPAEVGILAAIGCVRVPVRRKPRLAILGSGDELVEPGHEPLPQQIRNSNSYQLLAQAAANDLDAVYLGIAPDDPHVTRRMIERGLEADVFISTGGVSVGDKDHVGAAFKDLGVEVFFNKVSIKPGKPTTFGRRGQTLVFGLPGNPVAALVCFHLFVMTALRQRMGYAEPLPSTLRLPLKGSVKVGGDRPVFRPGKYRTEDGATRVEPLRWHGSGDLTGCASADGFIFQPALQALNEGEHVCFYPL